MIGIVKSKLYFKFYKTNLKKQKHSKFGKFMWLQRVLNYFCFLGTTLCNGQITLECHKEGKCMLLRVYISLDVTFKYTSGLHLAKCNPEIYLKKYLIYLQIYLRSFDILNIFEDIYLLLLETRFQKADLACLRSYPSSKHDLSEE